MVGQKKMGLLLAKGKNFSWHKGTVGDDIQEKIGCAVDMKQNDGSGTNEKRKVECEGAIRKIWRCDVKQKMT